jgi:hypothetical protein
MLQCDFSGYDLPADIYADGIGAVDNLGENFRSILFVFSRGHGGILTRVPVLCLVRPKSVLRKDGAIAQQLQFQGDPRMTFPDRESQLHS